MDVQNGRSSEAVGTEGTAIGLAAYRPIILLLVAVPLSVARAGY